MRFFVVPIIMACVTGAAYAQEQSTKPSLDGTWNNGGVGSQCDIFPRQIIIKLNSGRRPVVESFNNEAGEWKWLTWRQDETQVVGLATDPSSLIWGHLNIGVVNNGQIRLTELGPEGPGFCNYNRTQPQP